jgi:hypothetical protein
MAGATDARLSPIAPARICVRQTSHRHGLPRRQYATLYRRARRTDADHKAQPTPRGTRRTAKAKASRYMLVMIEAVQ